MRLLERQDDGKLSLTEDLVGNMPAYAILSHTWGDDNQEVTFEDLAKDTGKSKAGHQKIRFCGEQAAQDGLRYFWVDTCCINKTDPVELQKSINSMFRWYKNAAKCYVYLSDVSIPGDEALRIARWFTRGWTLQELLAPSSVEFFSTDYKRLGDKKSLEHLIHKRTGIPVKAIQGCDLTQFSVDERVSWVAKRETKHEEDMAYSLLGIFGVFLPLIYGEGQENAFRRLRKEVDSHLAGHQYHNGPNVSERPEMSLNPKFVVPFRRDPDFVDRSTLLDQIREKCAVPGSWTALVGLGGVGKSQIAIEYTYRIREQSQNTSIFWVHASNAARFEQGYRDIADCLEISGREDPKADIFRLVHGYLRDKSIGQWLLILDNTDDASFLLEAQNKGQYPQSNTLNDRTSQPLVSFIPQCQKGSILITTRSRSTALKLVGGSDVITVDPMEKQLARTLLEKKLGSQSETGDLSELAVALEFMPLAIVQAAAFISQTAPRCSVQQYLEQFQRSDRKGISLLENEAAHPRRDREANNSILITWQISFDYLHQKRQSAAGLLSLMSFFDRQGIPEALLRTQPNWGSNLAVDSDEDTLSEASKDDHFEADVNALREFSFISVSVDGTMFEMHRLVQLATRRWLEACGQLEKWKQQYIKNLYSEFPVGDHRYWEKCQSLFPHAKLALAQKPEGDRSLVEWASLLYNAAWYAWKKGNIADAEILATRAMKARKKLYGQEHEDTLSSIGMVGLVYSLGGRWKDAEDLQVLEMETSSRVLGPEHPSTLTSMNNLASTYRNQGRWKEAEDLEVLVMETRKRLQGLEHLDTLTSMGNLASTYWNQGRWKEAEDLEVLVMETRKRLLGLEHPDTLTSMGSLASTYWNQGRWKEAQDLEVLVMETSLRVLGPKHPSTLTSMNNLASTYQNQGRWKEAEDLEVLVIETSLRVLGPEHPDTLTSMGNLASTYRKQGRWKEAEDLQVLVMETRKRVLGPEHPDTLTSMGNLASTYRKQGRWKEAEDLQVLVMETRKRLLGPEHPDTLNSSHNLAFTWKDQGKAKEALALMEECFQYQASCIGIDHPDTQSSLEALNEWREEGIN